MIRVTLHVRDEDMHIVEMPAVPRMGDIISTTRTAGAKVYNVAWMTNGSVFVAVHVYAQ